MSRTHEMKTWPGPFAALLDGSKTFEWRKDDRGFAVGDDLLLREWNPESGAYTGREMRRRISYLLGNEPTPGGSGLGGLFGVPEGYAVLGLAPSPSRDQGTSDARTREIVRDAQLGRWDRISPGDIEYLASRATEAERALADFRRDTDLMLADLHRSSDALLARATEAERERDEARAAIDYAMSERHASEAALAAAERRAEAAEAREREAREAALEEAAREAERVAEELADVEEACGAGVVASAVRRLLDSVAPANIDALDDGTDEDHDDTEVECVCPEGFHVGMDAPPDGCGVDVDGDEAASPSRKGDATP